MLCYRDKTFCGAFDTGRCINRACDRALSESQWQDAKARGLMVAFSDFSDTCESVIRPEQERDQ